jgi:hypothetical protein
MPKRQTIMNNQRVALYARVSTLLVQDPEMQLRELRDYASRRVGKAPGNMWTELQERMNRVRR